MFIIIVKNYKKRVVLFFSILILWISMFILSNFFLNNSLIYKVTINNSLSFSYPIDFIVENIYVNEQLSNSIVETNSSSKKPVAQGFTNFKSAEGRFSFNYPSLFQLNHGAYLGSDILYHIDFHDKPKTIHGFIQVWHLPYSLSEFLEKSKSTSSQNFTYFNSKQVKVNNFPGYLWDYEVRGNNGKYYKGSEVFFKNNSKMYRISYFVPKELWNKTQSDIFWSMVNSFKTF